MAEKSGMTCACFQKNYMESEICSFITLSSHLRSQLNKHISTESTQNMFLLLNKLSIFLFNLHMWPLSLRLIHQ